MKNRNGRNKAMLNSFSHGVENGSFFKMMEIKTIVLAVWLLGVFGGKGNAAAVMYPEVGYRSVGLVSVDKPAFLSLLPVGRAGDMTLLVSQFQSLPWKAGTISWIDRPERVMDKGASSSMEFTTMGNFKWPNEMQLIPEEALGVSGLVLLGDGFLVPLKGNGGLYAVNLLAGEQHMLIPEHDGCFYHKGEWADLNGDGHLDLIAARTCKGGSLFHPTFIGSLMWYKNPGSVPASWEGIKSMSPWEEFVLGSGPDVIIQTVELDNDASTTEIVATEFFSKRVSLWSISNSNASVLWTRIIDDTIGASYSVNTVDLNGDGRVELLINNHEHEASVNGIFAYELPADGNIRSGKFVRHTIAHGFKTVRKSNTEASPGFAYAFHPQKNGDSTQKKHIVVAGDGAEAAYLLRPTHTDFVYTRETIVTVDNTVGSCLVDDIDGDGYTDVLIADYEGNQILVYTFAPEQSSSYLAIN